LQELKQKLAEFIAERNWNQFHSPKNLAMALSVEASEIVEIFQWLTQEESYSLNSVKQEHLREEIGDVFLYLLNLAEKFQIDIVQAAKDKMVKNARKYPVEKSKNNMKKYNELE